MNLNVKAILAVTAWMKLSLNAESLGNKQITFLLNNVKIEHYNECWHSNSFVLWFCVPVFSGEGIFYLELLRCLERGISAYIYLPLTSGSGHGRRKHLIIFQIFDD